MKHLFVSYAIALALKEKGFDEACFGYYTPMKKWMMEGNKFNPEPHFHGPNWANKNNDFYFMYRSNAFGDRDSTVKNSEFTKAVHNIAVPLYQQVIDWFREKHSIVIETTYSSNIERETGFKYHVRMNANYNSKVGRVFPYYEALDRAIEQALNHYI